MTAAFGNRARFERRRGAREGLELFPEALECGLIETGADFRDVDEARAVIQANV